MSSPSTSKLFECKSCGNFGFGDGEIVCCEERMQPVEKEHSVTDPSLEELLATVFDMSETEMDICLCVMEGGEQTVPNLAEQVGYDRSSVSRHLEHLVELGVIDRRRRLLESGGHIYVYTPNGADEVSRRLTDEFAGWVKDAAVLIDSLSREKVEALVASEMQDPQWKIYQK